MSLQVNYPFEMMSSPFRTIEEWSKAKNSREFAYDVEKSCRHSYYNEDLDNDRLQGKIPEYL